MMGRGEVWGVGSGWVKFVWFVWYECIVWAWSETSVLCEYSTVPTYTVEQMVLTAKM